MAQTNAATQMPRLRPTLSRNQVAQPPGNPSLVETRFSSRQVADLPIGVDQRRVGARPCESVRERRCKVLSRRIEVAIFSARINNGRVTGDAREALDAGLVKECCCFRQVPTLAIGINQRREAEASSDPILLRLVEQILRAHQRASLRDRGDDRGIHAVGCPLQRPRPSQCSERQRHIAQNQSTLDDIRQNVTVSGVVDDRPLQERKPI